MLQWIHVFFQWEIPMLGEPELSKLKKGQLIQLQRRGFFRVDVAHAPISQHTSKATPLILFHVPDGHTKDLPGQVSGNVPRTTCELPIGNIDCIIPVVRIFERLYLIYFTSNLIKALKFIVFFFNFYDPSSEC